jgi:hypothetical protein
MEGIGGAPAMAHELVLHAAADLVKLVVGEPDEVKRLRHLGDVRERVVEGPAEGPERSKAPYLMVSLHSTGLASIQRLAALASRPSTTSSSWAVSAPTSTMEVHQFLAWKGPLREKNVSSRPRAWTAPIRAGRSTMSSP